MVSDNGMILVMGETGVGKSTFINALKPNAVEVGHTLKSVQSRPQAVQIHLDEEGQNSITVVDTPGFDDSHRPDSEVLTEITEFLAAQYAAKIPLKGVIYLHRIQDNRMKGSARRYLDVFRSLCGEEALGDVMLVTTFWNKVQNHERGEYLRREQELIDDYWSPMQKKGSIIAKFDGSKEAAESLILQLAFSGRDVVLDIQRELVDDQKVISETTAGLGINEQLDVDIKRWRERASKVENELAVAEDERNSEKVKQLKDEKRELHRVIGNLDKSKKRMQSRVGNEMKSRLDKESRQKLVVGGISVFATVLSITLTIVKFVAFGESNSSGSSFKRGLRRVGNKLKGGSANDAESGQSGVMLKPDELDPLQMRSEHEKLGQDSSGERAGLPLQGGTTDPAQDGRKLALPSNSDGNGHNTTRNLLQAQADGMRPDILEMSSDGHLGSLSASIDPQYLSLEESSHDRQAETASIQPIASQGSWPRDQARIKDTPSTQINRKPMARGDPSYSVKAVSEVIPAIELNDNDKLDKSQGGIHSESHLSSLTDRYTPTGLVSSHQATITSANSKTRDTNFVVTNNLCDNCCDLETKLEKRDKIISDLKNLIENLENLTKHLESENEDSAAREKDLKDQLQQAKDLIQRKLSEKGGPIVRQTIPGVGLLPDSEIILRWKNLCWSLRQHVTSHIAIPSRQFIQAESHDRGRLAALQNITPTFTLFLRSKNDCIDIIQAVIWDTLTNYIFASRGCSSWVYWSGNIHDTLKATIDGLSRGHWEDTNFHHWRSQTAALISSYALDGEIKVRATSIVGELEKNLKHLLKGWESGLRNDLFKLVIDALKLDIDLYQQKAWWFCEYPGAPDRRTRYDIEFQSATMKAANDDLDDPAATHATLMISPALMKAGTSNGGNYNMEQLIVESSVHRGKPRMTTTKSKPASNTMTTLVRGGRPAAHNLARQDQRRAQSGAEEKKHGEKKTSFFKHLVASQ